MTARKPDYLIFVLVLGLTLFGLIMVFSASYYTYAVKESATSGITVLIKQGQMVVIGLVFMIVAMQIPYRLYNKWRFKSFSALAMLAVVASIILLVVVLLLPGDKNGAKRWITIAGISFQPSEIARLAMILFVADEFAHKREDLIQRRDFGRFFRAFLPSLMVTGAVCALILLGSNLSMTAATGMAFICMCVVTGINWRFIAVMVLGALALGVLFTIIEPYRMARAVIFTDPFQDPSDKGYQLVQSLYALGSGGLTGVGLGNSTQKYLYLTYGDSDFIYSIIGEEIGFIGLVVLLTTYGLLIIRGLRCAWYAHDTYGLMLSTGIIAAIGIQLLINVAVCTSSMPPTGLPLPFISNGGSSMIIFLAETGILLNVSRYSRQT